MSNKITITVDGRRIETASKIMLLEILEGIGSKIPRLCNHPSLTPSGACRLCVVEITKKEWPGYSKIVTSCLYPAEEGLIVATRSEPVLKLRRSLLELYLAQCPGSEEIKALARLEGVDGTSFTIEKEDNKCVLCRLCTRVCQERGPGAISTLSRGVDKSVGPNPAGKADDCTGCRTCAHICPTGAIPLKQEKQVLKIWNKNFAIPICSVQSDLCRGCGTCEEVCPFSVPIVRMYKDGLTVSQISASSCVGCGICAGACPTGAISQKKTAALSDFNGSLYKKDLRGKTIVFACSRSPLPDAENELIRVSCIGSVDISTILYCLAAGANAIALMCRDRASCPYSRGGDLGEKRLAVARELLGYCGLQKERAVLLQPYAGQDGPGKTWQEYKETIKSLANPMAEVYVWAGKRVSGMDLALEIVSWLKNRPELKTTIPAAIAALFAAPPAANPALLYLDRIPELQLLSTLIMDDELLQKTLEKAAELFRQKGIAVSCLGSAKELVQAHGQTVFSFSPVKADPMPGHTTFTTINELAGVKAAVAEEAFSFQFSPGKRKKLMARYRESQGPLLCSTPEHCLQYALLLKPGTWQQSLQEKPALLFVHEMNKSEKAGPRKTGTLRINNHPILLPMERREIDFTFNDRQLKAYEGEVVTSALYAAGITVFGHHEKDGAAQGIYCVNGQCSQCMVIADNRPVKGCMTPVLPNMKVYSLESPPDLNDDKPVKEVLPTLDEVAVDVLIIGGGPAGISAGIELGGVGVEVLVVDDKQELGGKLSLQTHNFFGSVADCYAGSRGIQIGKTMAADLLKLPTVKVWLNSTVIGVFSDGKFGVSANGKYKLVKPKKVLFTTGAREKSLAFPGCDLPGVYGAGAFQTLVNRDLVRCAERLFIIGGGNVGLIGAYHALQAGIDVVGLVEALPRCGGYKVHEDKIKRLGVPIWTSHTALRIEGREKVERIVTAAIDDKFQPIPGTERMFTVDTVLIAVGLSPVNELLQKAKAYGIEAYAAGDAEEIAEASAAIFSGKISGRKIAQSMGIDLPIPGNWAAFGELLKHHAGAAEPFRPKNLNSSVYPLIRCMQEIPCNPCIEACPNRCITMPGSILSLPEFNGECIGCGSCVLACPGLAINLVIDDYDAKKEKALLLMPYEFINDIIPLGKTVTTTDMEGNVVGKGKVIAYKTKESQNYRRLLLLEVPYKDKMTVAGFRIREIDEGQAPAIAAGEEADPVVCRCERVRKSEIVREIRAGIRDMNQLKAKIRAGLGGCNGKTCTELILRLFRDEGVPLAEITMPTQRPLVAEVHLGDFIAKGIEENR